MFRKWHIIGYRYWPHLHSWEEQFISRSRNNKQEALRGANAYNKTNTKFWVHTVEKRKVYQ